MFAEPSEHILHAALLDVLTLKMSNVDFLMLESCILHVFRKLSSLEIYNDFQFLE